MRMRILAMSFGIVVMLAGAVFTLPDSSAPRSPSVPARASSSPPLSLPIVIQRPATATPASPASPASPGSMPTAVPPHALSLPTASAAEEHVASSTWLYLAAFQDPYASVIDPRSGHTLREIEVE